MYTQQKDRRLYIYVWGNAHASPQNCLFWGPGFGTSFWSNTEYNNKPAIENGDLLTKSMLKLIEIDR